MRDINMDLGHKFAEGLGPAPELPSSLTSVQQRAQLVNDIDGAFLTANDVDTEELFRQIGGRIREIVEKSKIYVPDVADPLVRLNICLRLWAGCVSAAKTIALETRSGPNTPKRRAEIFMTRVDVLARDDPIYRAGVEAAPAFKKLRGQNFSLEGVPEGSAVLNAVNQELQGRSST